MTITLLLNSEGKKMGKTEKGAVWLDAEKTTPYEFYQYWRNVSDQDVIKCLKLLTFVPIEQIEEMERTLEGQQLNQAKELLAYELTALVQGRSRKGTDCGKGGLWRRRKQCGYADHRSESRRTHRRRHRDPDLDGTLRTVPVQRRSTPAGTAGRRFCE